ncbi:MAG TPA: GNAT family N-acetyltransferase [Candidatus Methanoperedens sp.]|nr:GNAT family N-acetyltransferase [Candidatus Methanoperedens sp.]
METVVCRSLWDGPWTSGEWNELVRASATNTIFQTFQWHAAWWRSYGADYRPLVIAGLDGGRLRGIAPLMISGDKRISFIGDGRSDFHDVIVAEPDKTAFLEAVFALLHGRRAEWDSIAFTNIPDSSTTVPTLSALCGRYRFFPLVQRDVVNHVLVVAGAEPEARAIMDRSELRRRTNFFQRRGVLKYSQLEDRATAEEYLPIFFAQHQKRWKRHLTRSIFESSTNRQFYLELLKELLPCRWLHWSLLEFDGKPIAFHFGFDYNGVLTWYKPSFEVAIANRSPGKVLLRHLIGYALENGRQELDFTVGDEAFKLRYKNRTRKNTNIVMFRQQSLYYRILAFKQARAAARRVFHQFSFCR